MAVAEGGAFTLATSAARTSGANGTAVVVGGWRRAIVELSVTASATDAGDTLDVYVDVLAPDGVTWLNAIHFAQQAGNGAAKKEFAVLDPSNPGTASIAVTSDAAAGAVRPALFGPQMRARWAIVDSGDHNSSHTFAVSAYLV
jgi:hypothetical protein